MNKVQKVSASGRTSLRVRLSADMYESIGAPARAFLYVDTTTLYVSGTDEAPPKKGSMFVAPARIWKANGAHWVTLPKMFRSQAGLEVGSPVVLAARNINGRAVVTVQSFA